MHFAELIATPGTCTVKAANILNQFKDSTLRTRLFLAVRWWLTSNSELVKLLPSKGNILDLGCGHGLLAITSALQSPDRRCVGVDHDTLRIQEAIRASSGLPNIRFELGTIQSAPPGPWEAITVIDSMHYFTRDVQVKALKHIFDSLAAGGLFLMREVDKTPGWRSHVNRIHEKVMTTLGITKGDGLCFHRRDEWESMLRETGFLVTSRNFSRIPFADVLFICQKPN